MTWVLYICPKGCKVKTEQRASCKEVGHWCKKNKNQYTKLVKDTPNV